MCRQAVLQIIQLSLQLGDRRDRWGCWLLIGVLAPRLLPFDRVGIGSLVVGKFVCVLQAVFYVDCGKFGIVTRCVF